MNYAQARAAIKSGDIIALTHTEWDSLYDLQIQAVRTFTQSEYAHVAVAWVVGGRVFVIEAVTPKVRILPLSNLKDAGFYLIQTDIPMNEQELEYGLSKVGLESYSKWDAIQGQLGTLEVGENSLWQCSELVVAMRRLSGLDLGRRKITPSSVVQAALEHGYELRYVKNEQ